MKKVKGFFGKLFNFKKDGKVNTKKVICTVAIVAVIIIAVVLCSFLGNGNKQEKELTAKLQELGIGFYEDYYYDLIGSNAEEREKVLSKFTSIGIKVNLDNLFRLNSDNSEELKALFVNAKTGESCDVSNSKVVIYPEEKYGKTDYKIETILECGFNSKKDDEVEEEVETTTQKATTTTTTTAKITTTKKAKK